VPFTYEYARPAVTVDVAIFTIRNSELTVLLIKRAHAPFKGSWALPGGFVDESESLEHAALRELQEETSLTGVRLVQIGAFGDPGRDPRGHTVSVAFLAFAVSAGRPAHGSVRAGDDASAAEWHSVAALERAAAGRRRVRLAFDHAAVLARSLEVLRHEASQLGVRRAVDFVPPRFALSELQHVYEAVIGHAVDKRNFRAKLIADKTVVAIETEQRTGRHRPAQLYRWAEPVPSPEPAQKPEPAPKKPAPAKSRSAAAKAPAKRAGAKKTASARPRSISAARAQRARAKT
jgi:8-oxo-dGTP diphosphatase